MWGIERFGTLRSACPMCTTPKYVKRARDATPSIAVPFRRDAFHIDFISICNCPVCFMKDCRLFLWSNIRAVGKFVLCEKIQMHNIIRGRQDSNSHMSLYSRGSTELTGPSVLESLESCERCKSPGAWFHLGSDDECEASKELGIRSDQVLWRFLHKAPHH